MLDFPIWGVLSALIVLVYGGPLLALGGRANARHLDARDRALRAVHGAFALSVPALAYGLLRGLADEGPIDAPGPAAEALLAGLALAALVVPLVFAARAHRRLTARTRLLADALAGAPHVRLERLPADHRRGGELAVGPGVVPTHVLVRVAPGDGGYRVAAERREEIALFCEGASDDPAERGARRV